MDRELLEKKKAVLRKLALRSPGREKEGDYFRSAYAQTIAAPILTEVNTQSSVMSIFSVVEVAPEEQAMFQVEPSILPSTNKFTGAPTTPLLVFNHPGGS
jgi:hypothetical protein